MSQTRIKCFSFLCLILNLILVQSTEHDVKIQLNHGGILVGHHMSTVNGRQMHAFRGVPYAKPPIGDLRFKPPVPFGAWEGERLATNDSSMCPQLNLIPGPQVPQMTGDEDCLYLNVYVPETKLKDNLPVMVWFHGGGFEFGDGLSTTYGPDYLLDRDIILVTSNYRLGPLGFLSTETLDCPGNFGLKDQVEVLKWVQANIAAFGGNPKSVTIFGESAGGGSVTLHMLSESSKGLFHKGIAQSGTYFCPWSYPTPKGVAAKKAHKLAKLLDCDNNNDDWSSIISCLRTKPAAEINGKIPAFYEWRDNPQIPFAPIVEPIHDTAFLTKYPREVENPHGNSIPLLIGQNKDEGLIKSLIVLKSDYLEELKSKFDEYLPYMLLYNNESPEKQKLWTQKLKEFYFNNDFNYVDPHNFQNFTDLISDAYFTQGFDELMRLRMNSGASDTFTYYFIQKSKVSFSKVITQLNDVFGVSHADELQYLFYIASFFPNVKHTGTELEVRENMLDLWTNFAKFGNPTPEESKLPKWPVTKKYPYTYYKIGKYEESDDKPLFEVQENLLKERFDFWNNLLKATTNEKTK